MNKSYTFQIRILLSIIIFICGNLLIYYLIISPPTPFGLPALTYIITIVTYFVIGFILNILHIPTSKKTLCMISTILLMILVFPFIFVSLPLSYFIVATHLYIFLSFILGCFIRAIFTRNT